MSVIILKVIWDFSHAHRFFKNSKGSLEIKLIGYLLIELASIESPRVFKNIWEF